MTLKKPPTLTSPVSSVVADSIIDALDAGGEGAEQHQQPGDHGQGGAEEEVAPGVAGQVAGRDLQVDEEHGQSSVDIASTGVTRMAIQAG